MRVLVSGGAGFIGTRLVHELMGRGHQVRILDNLSPQVHGPRAQERRAMLQATFPGLEFIVGSVTERARWVEAIDGQDAIVHLAAETGTGQSMYESEHYASVNVGGTALMLDVLGAESHRVSKVLLASSRAVTGEGKYRDAGGALVYPGSRLERDLAAGRFELYHERSGEALQALGTDEDTPFHPVSVYGITKQAQEQLVAAGCKALDLPFVALRFQNVYGPGQSLSNPYTGILSIFSTRMLAGREIEIFEDGLESRDFVFVDDVVSVTADALLRAEADNQVLSIGSGVRTTVLEAARVLQESLGCEAELRVSGRYRVGDIRHNFADIAKAQRLLGFAPKVSFAEGVQRLADWVRRQPEGEDGYERSLGELSGRGFLRGGSA